MRWRLQLFPRQEKKDDIDMDDEDNNGVTEGLHLVLLVVCCCQSSSFKLEAVSQLHSMTLQMMTRVRTPT